MNPSTITRGVIKRAKRGDKQAISRLYQAYVDQIYRYIVYRVGTTQDAEDLTAEVFVRMVEGLGDYKITGAPFEAWLYRIASARVADYHRQNHRRTHVELMDNIMSDDPNLEETLLEQSDNTELHAALKQLNDEEQTILFMRFMERKSHNEVAALLEKSVTAVKSTQHRALTRLASLLGEDKIRHYLRGHHD